MILSVEITETELTKLITDALTKQFGKPVTNVTLKVTAMEDCRGETYGHTISATAIFGE